MELQIQHIIGYLPWGLEVQISEECLVKGKIPSVRRRMVGIVDEEIHVHKTGYIANTKHDIEDCAPLLKPMTKEVLEEVFKNIHFVEVYRDNEFIWNISSASRFVFVKGKFLNYPKWVINLFHKHHVDYQDLIGKGLAVNILTLKAK